MRLLFILLIFCGIMLKQAYSQAHVVVFEIVDYMGDTPDVSEFSVDVEAIGVTLADRWKTFNANTTTPCGANKLTVKVDFQGFGPTTSRPIGTSYVATFKQTRAGKIVAQYELTTTLQPIGNNYFSCQTLGAISLKPGLLEPMLFISSQFTNEERSAGSTFLATVSNVPADFLNKGYRIDWGDSGITTGTVKGAGPYEVTGHIGENFEAPDGEMKVRLLKDTSTVAEANLLPRAGIISVPNKEVCAGIKGERIVANVTSWQPGYFIRWLDNSYHDEPRLVAINDTEVEIRGDFPAGTHTLWAWLFDDTGDIVATTRFTLTVKTSPVARIVTKSLCVSKGETFVLTAEASENCRYAWDYDLARSLLLDLTINGVMGDYPLQYIFSATDKTSGCVAQDTAIVRTGPAAPQVSIDTNTNRLDIKIHWTPVSDATAYHVYSRKWDPYCLTSENGGTYTKTVVTSTSYIRSASNVASDTLAFFYVTATNGTCESSASDTVGYKLDNLLINVGKTSNNMVSWMFDMTGKGIETSEDLFDRIGKSNIWAIRKWLASSQSWFVTIPNPLFEILEGEEEYMSVFDLLIGNVYQFDVAKETKLLQYGKLPEPFEFNLNKGNASSAITLAFLQPYRADLYSSDEIFSEIEELLFIRYWNFENQDWRFSYKEEGEIIGTFRLRPILMPLQIELVNGVSGPVKWK